ncbi:MAG: hypothetical protein JNL58_03380 [Planctomyces sp.]|nr:hypothetical protein [Planctomyces sp.]
MSSVIDDVQVVDGSFRDRCGRVFLHGDRVFRSLTDEGLSDWRQISRTRFFREGSESGQIVRTWESHPAALPADLSDAVLVLEHERIPAVTWPWEWSFSMLKDAALSHLELMLAALSEDCILKDATPLNWQFSGGRWVLMDTGSVVPHTSGHTWEGYRQFCETFLFPLMLQAWKEVHFQPWLRGRISGIPVDQFARMLSFRDMFRRGAMIHVWLHSKLQTKRLSSSAVSDSVREGGFDRSMIVRNVESLQGVVQGLHWRESESEWSDYDQSSEPVQRDSAEKEAFVECVCSSRRWTTIWDLGCNLGRYSEIAARFSDLVLAFDSDHLTIDQMYRKIRRKEIRNIIPLVMDLTDPSPSLGWRHRERLNLEQRSTPELILCLALIHHLVISGQLLLHDVMDWLASFHAEVVFEYVDRQDAQTKVLLQNRRDVFIDYSRENFLAAVQARFEIVDEYSLPCGTRTLYHLRPHTRRFESIETNGV